MVVSAKKQESRLGKMAEAEFDALIDDYIERTAGGYGEMPAAHFLALLEERAAGQSEECGSGIEPDSFSGKRSIALSLYRKQIGHRDT